jgi:hypothetical protein
MNQEPNCIFRTYHFFICSVEDLTTVGLKIPFLRDLNLCRRINFPIVSKEVTSFILRGLDVRKELLSVLLIKALRSLRKSGAEFPATKGQSQKKEILSVGRPTRIPETMKNVNKESRYH